MQSRVNEVKDTVFADFSRSLGIASIREYEEGQLARARRYAERRAELEQQARGFFLTPCYSSCLFFWVISGNLLF